MTEEINKIKERVVHTRATSLSFIKRVPKATEEVFIKFSNDEFCGDYGMALKYLVDKVFVEPQPFEVLDKVLQQHEARLMKLEGADKPQPKKHKVLSGRGIREQPQKQEEIKEE